VTPVTISLVIFASVFGATLLAFLLRLALPKDHLSTETKDTVKLAMGLVATMAALVLGLLISSAKGSYDADRNQVIAMAAKIDFLDRILAVYGPESTGARQSLRQAVEGITTHLWPETTPAQLDPGAAAAQAEKAYQAIQNLTPQNEEQKAMKAQALGILYDIAQIRWLLFEQAAPSISITLVVVVVCWLAILFFSFGLFAPANGTALTALMVGAISVALAVFLILELDQPFSGFIQVSSRPMLNAANHQGNR